jgi:ABC-2 type transport system permease protein
MFDAMFAGNILSIFTLTLLGGGIFLLIGLLISNYATSYETASPITAAIGMPMIFFGNLFFPTQNLPGALKTFSQILPTTYLSEGLRQTYLYSLSLGQISRNLLILLLWFVGLLIITAWLFKLKDDN